MDITKFYANPNEKPLDNILSDGGFCGIFRTVGCIGDSLSSGEFESTDEAGNKGYHDHFEYSWIQYIARMAGLTAYNFTRGGMTAKEFWDGFGGSCHCWDDNRRCQAYVIALGVNDLNRDMPLGSVNDINTGDYRKNGESFAGYFAKIIQRLKELQPKARFFLMTMPLGDDEERNKVKVLPHAALLNDMAKIFEYTYVIDLAKYGPVYDEKFRKAFYLGGHLSAAGYLLTAKMTASYIDYIIRNNFEDFAQIGFVGTPYHNKYVKW